VTGEADLGKGISADRSLNWSDPFTVVDTARPSFYSEKGPGILRPRVALATFLVVACAACGSNSVDPAPVITTSPSMTAPTKASSVPPELAGFTAQQRTAFEQALAAYDSFVKRSDGFYSDAQTSVAAKNFYQRMSIDWATAWSNLAQAADNHITVSGPTRVLWTRPVRIRLGTMTGDSITIHRCVDESRWVVTQNGKKLAQPELKSPHVYAVQLEKRRGETWWRSGEPTQGATC
jgi:hypothetical protein